MNDWLIGMRCSCCGRELISDPFMVIENNIWHYGTRNMCGKHAKWLSFVHHQGYDMSEKMANMDKVRGKEWRKEFSQTRAYYGIDKVKTGFVVIDTVSGEAVEGKIVKEKGMVLKGKNKKETEELNKRWEEMDSYDYPGRVKAVR